MKSVAFSLCFITALAWSASAPDTVSTVTWNPNTIVDFDVAITAAREVPRNMPLPGLHLEAKVNNRKTDIYIAPMDFVAEFQINIAAGDDVRIIGSLTRLGDTDVVLAREVTVGRNVIYVRNDAGEPLWTTPPAV